MTKLIPIIAISLILAAIAELLSVKEYDTLGNFSYVRKNRWCVVFLAIAATIFVGLRTDYNDTATYVKMYNDLNISEAIDWSLGENPGFWLVNRFLKSHSMSSQNFLMFYAAITLPIYIWFLRKYSEDFLFSVFLFITMGCFTFTLAAIKQTVAVAFCLVATDRCIQKKYLRFIFWVLLAALFHPYALMYLVVPLFVYRPWSVWTYIVLVVFAIVGITLSRIVGTIVDITTMLGEEYDAQSFVGEGVNVFRVAVVWVPVLLSFLAKSAYLFDCEDNRARNIIMNLTMLNAAIMFVGLFGTANYFARLANYFLIFQALALPTIIRYYERSSRNFIKYCAIAGFSAYCYYAEVIANGSFDSMFRSVTLWAYLTGK